MSCFAPTEGGSLAFTPTANGSGTGSALTLYDQYGDPVDTFTLVIFGDVNGDVWYDGTDAYYVRLMAIGMIPADDLTDAQRAAADCNHDGVIDLTDAALLERAGLLLEQVDQSLPGDGLKTNSVYLEYCSVIDQLIESEGSEPDQPQAAVQPAAGVWQSILDLFNRIVNLLTAVFSIVVLK